METNNQNIETEPNPKDISSEFLNMTVYDFIQFLRNHKEEPALSICVDWADNVRAKRLKAFLEDYSSTTRGNGQKRLVTIRATSEQHDNNLDFFSSGIRWEKI